MSTMLKGIVIPADPDKEAYLEEIERGCREQYQWLVAGDYEIVHLHNPDCSLFMNRTGTIRTKKANPRATAFVYVHRPELNGEDIVLGDAFILGPKDKRANDTDAPEQLRTLLFDTHSFVIEAQAAHDAPVMRSTKHFDTWERAYDEAVEVAKYWGLSNGVRVVPA
jgi:hypothetical protein